MNQVQQRQLYDALIKSRDFILTEFEQHCAEQNPEINFHTGLLNLNTRTEDSLEFKYVGCNFLIKAEPKIYLGLLHFKTFELISNSENYPNIKMVHVPELDIVSNGRGAIRFTRKIVVKGMVMGTPMETEMSQISDFPNQYVGQISGYLNNKQQSDAPTIE